MMTDPSELMQHDGVRLTFAIAIAISNADGPHSRRDLLQIASDVARLAREWEQIQLP